MKLLTALIILALIATVVAMVLGLRSMGRGGAYDDKHSGRFMIARILFQGIAVLLLIFALILG
jgi:hypothetical protein